ncbi:MAG: PepSY domain-containing protein [bacterium]
MRILNLLRLLLLLLLPVMTCPAWSGDRLRGLQIAGKPTSQISQDQAVGIARQRYKGRVLSTKPGMYGGRKFHNVRILSKDGRVRQLRVDAVTGEIVKAPRQPGKR